MCNILFTSDNFELLVIHDYANQIHVGIDKCLVWMRKKGQSQKWYEYSIPLPVQRIWKVMQLYLGLGVKLK